jgi:hypothetical protein
MHPTIQNHTEIFTGVEKRGNKRANHAKVQFVVKEENV